MWLYIIGEPEILLDSEHGINKALEVAQKVEAEVFYYLAKNNVMFECIILKPIMVTLGAEINGKDIPQQIANYTVRLLRQHIPLSCLNSWQVLFSFHSTLTHKLRPSTKG